MKAITRIRYQLDKMKNSIAIQRFSSGQAISAPTGRIVSPNPVEQYDFEIYNCDSPIIGLRMYGDLEVVCDSFDELDIFFEKHAVNMELEAAMAGFLRAAYKMDYMSAATYLEQVLACGYHVDFVFLAGFPAIFRVVQGDAGGFEGHLQSLPDFDQNIYGGDLGNIMRACIFSCVQYEFDIFNTVSPILGVKRFGHFQLTCNTFNELEQFFEKHAVNMELEAAMAGFLRAAYKMDYMSASAHLEKVYMLGYFIRLEITSDLPPVLRVIKGGGSKGLKQSLSDLNPVNYDGNVKNLLTVLITCIGNSTQTNSGEQYDFEIYGGSSPLIGLRISRNTGNNELIYDSFDELDHFFKRRGGNLELEMALAGFLRAAYEEDYMLASRHMAVVYAQGYSAKILIPPGDSPSILRFDSDSDWAELGQSLLVLDETCNIELQHVVAATFISCMHGLYNAGYPLKSLEIADKFLARGKKNAYIEDVRVAQERLSQGAEEDMHPLVKSLATGSDEYLKFFKGKTCNHPVSDFEVGTEGLVYVCCPSYLPQAIGNAFTAKSIDEIIQSKKAKLIRESIKKQDFRFCRWLHCKEIDSLPRVESPKVKKDVYPVDFRLSYDSTCNLWCVTCRKEKLTVRGEQRETMIRATEDIIIPLLKNAKSVMMNGYGDVFASKPCRRILHRVNRRDNPNLKINIITNAILFTEQEWLKFRNIHDMMGHVRISIDAATKQTYDKIRLGGNWDILMENLKFISRLRDEGSVRYMSISFVYQRENFREMAEFALLGKELRCDLVIFEAVMNWNVFSSEEFNARSVHHPTNPLHAEFLHELKRLRGTIPSASPHVVWQQEHAGKRITLLSLNSRF